MRKYLIFFGMCCLLMACSQQQLPIGSTPQQRATASSQNILQLLLQIAQTDLTTTIQIANAVPPPIGPDVAQIKCATFLQGFIPTLAPNAGAGLIAPTGIISTFETARAGAMIAESGTGGLSIGQQSQLDDACGALAVSTARLVAVGGLNIALVNGNSYVQMLLALGRASMG